MTPADPTPPTPETTCDACGRRRSWGCGHSKSQERDARRHAQTKAHRTGACWHFDHDACDPKTCKLAGKHTPGYAAFVKHADARTCTHIDGHTYRGALGGVDVCEHCDDRRPAQLPPSVRVSR